MYKSWEENIYLCSIKWIYVGSHGYCQTIVPEPWITSNLTVFRLANKFGSIVEISKEFL